MHLEPSIASIIPVRVDAEAQDDILAIPQGKCALLTGSQRIVPGKVLATILDITRESAILGVPMHAEDATGPFFGVERFYPAPTECQST